MTQGFQSSTRGSPAPKYLWKQGAFATATEDSVSFLQLLVIFKQLVQTKRGDPSEEVSVLERQKLKKEQKSNTERKMEVA